MTGECVSGEQNRIDRQHDRARGDPELSPGPERFPDVVPEKEKHQQRYVQKIAMKVLEDEREGRLAAIVSTPPLRDRASGRMQREGSVVRLAVVVAGETESTRCPENQDRRREPLRQCRPVLEIRRIERREKLAR